MRVYGLKSPVKNLGWLLGGLFFLLAAFYPPFPSVGMYGSFVPTQVLSGWVYDLSQVATTGGLGWHILSYIRWQHFASVSWTGRTLFTEFAPYSFVPVILPLCSIIIWRLLVYNAERPTVIRGLLAVLLALASSLLLVFLLAWVGGRVLLYILSISPRGAFTARSLISFVWGVSIAQSVWFLLPCLVLGGALARWQARMVLRYLGEDPKVKQ